MGTRRVPHVRKFLGEQLRSVRRQRGWSQAALGRESSLSGKFIGEVERGEKSISLDSLYRVARALGIPLRQLTDVGGGRRGAPREEVERVTALLVRRRKPDEIRKAYEVLRALFSDKPSSR
jgi:transcriptional regulator with XRE-family HTH domain